MSEKLSREEMETFLSLMARMRRDEYVLDFEGIAMAFARGGEWADVRVGSLKFDGWTRSWEYSDGFDISEFMEA